MDNDEVQQEHRYRPKPLLRTPGVGLGGQSGDHPGPIPVQHLAGKGAPEPGHPRKAGQLPKACPGPGQSSSAEEAPRGGEMPLGREAPQPLLHGGGWSRPGLPQGCCGQSMLGGKGSSGGSGGSGTQGPWRIFGGVMIYHGGCPHIVGTLVSCPAAGPSLAGPWMGVAAPLCPAGLRSLGRWAGGTQSHGVGSGIAPP